jgi:hypothetical protein
MKMAMLNGTKTDKQRLQVQAHPRGNDGISPVVEVEETESGFRVTITDIYGTHKIDLAHGKDGYNPVKDVDYFDGKDGKDGYTPVKGVDYFDGEKGDKGDKGDPGYTPQKGIDYFDGKDGTNGKDGADGQNGKDGANGTSITVVSITESNADGGSNVVTFSDGSKLTVKNGSKGSQGEGGSSITVDDAFNPESTNPVQNKVICAFVLEANETVLQIQNSIPTDEHINGLINTALGVIENGTY